MKTTVLLLLAAASSVLAQGPLTPPGAPAATMKSLDQIEARTAIPKSPAVPIAGPHYTISQPASYYPTGSVTNSRATANFKSGIYVGVDVAAHCVASGNSGDPTTVDKEIFVAAGGQRDACVPASE